MDPEGHEREGSEVTGSLWTLKSKARIPSQFRHSRPRPPPLSPCTKSLEDRSPHLPPPPPPPSLPHPCSLWRRDLAFCPRLAHWRCVRACHSSARCRHERHDTVTNTDYTPARSPSVSSGSTEKSGISIAGTNRKPPAAYLVRVYIYCHSILPACRWLGVLIEPLAAPLNLLVQLPIAVAIDSWTSNFSVPALIHIWYNHQWIGWIINRAVHIHTQGVFVVTEHQLYTNIKRARLSLTTLKYFC